MRDLNHHEREIKKIQSIPLKSVYAALKTSFVTRKYIILTSAQFRYAGHVKRRHLDATKCERYVLPIRGHELFCRRFVVFIFSDTNSVILRISGDVRVNENIALVSTQTLWVLEHNRIAAELKKINPSWNDERLYQEARKIVIAMHQHITYKEYIPKVIGPEMANR